uniref:omega-amidase n=1 Tax=Graphocephala atropunctata TaxID=36148 RepID=A0A1B6LV30_9HEMI
MEKLKTLRIALVQMAVGEDLGENIQRAVKHIKDAKAKQSSLIVLPECFNSPYGTKHFPKYAEPIPTGGTSKALSEVAKDNEVFLVAGSVPEREGNKFYNTTTVWSPKGELICKHRKVHLFDIDIPGGIRFKESECLSPGNNLTTFNISNLKIGVGICYDLRFGELSRLYRKQGVDMLLYPGAFNMKTGPLHWELLLRARAVDEQVFVAGVSPAQDTEADYVAWGHSMVVDPWGKVLQQAEFKEESLIVDLDLTEIDNIRKQIPTFEQRREDLYDTVEVKSKM